jgi:hypothetical protein
VAEKQLVASLPAEKGRDLLKQVRIHLVETARPVMEAMIQQITGVKVVSLHHDISPGSPVFSKCTSFFRAAGGKSSLHLSLVYFG